MSERGFKKFPLLCDDLLKAKLPQTPQLKLVSNILKLCVQQLGIIIVYLYITLFGSFSG